MQLDVVEAPRRNDQRAAGFHPIARAERRPSPAERIHIHVAERFARLIEAAELRQKPRTVSRTANVIGKLWREGHHLGNAGRGTSRGEPVGRDGPAADRRGWLGADDGAIAEQNRDRPHKAGVPVQLLPEGAEQRRGNGAKSAGTRGIAHALDLRMGVAQVEL